MRKVLSTYIRFLSVSLFFFSSAVSCFGQGYNDLLNQAYAQNSATLFASFFDGWSEKNAPVSRFNGFDHNDTVKEAYSVFEFFFSSSIFDTVAGSALSKAFYENHPYIMVQNSLKVGFTKRIYHTSSEIDSLGLVYTKKQMMQTNPPVSEYDFIKNHNNEAELKTIIIYNGESERKSLSEPASTYTIPDFKPTLQCSGKKTLYLTEKLDTVINTFLRNKYISYGTPRVFSIPNMEENTKRKKALETFVKFWYVNVDNNWRLMTYPYVQSLTFDKSMLLARLKIKLSYEGAEVILKKTSPNTWAVIYFKRTAVFKD